MSSPGPWRTHLAKSNFHTLKTYEQTSKSIPLQRLSQIFARCGCFFPTFLKFWLKCDSCCHLFPFPASDALFVHSMIPKVLVFLPAALFLVAVAASPKQCETNACVEETLLLQKGQHGNMNMNIENVGVGSPGYPTKKKKKRFPPRSSCWRCHGKYCGALGARSLQRPRALLHSQGRLRGFFQPLGWKSLGVGPEETCQSAGKVFVTWDQIHLHRGGSVARTAGCAGIMAFVVSSKGLEPS